MYGVDASESLLHEFHNRFPAVAVESRRRVGCDESTGVARKLRLEAPAQRRATWARTGIPGVPHIPFTINSDGSTNLFDETLAGLDGNLFATFDAFSLGTGGVTVKSQVAPDLYRINPVSGVATLIGPVPFNLGASFAFNGTLYAFNDLASQVVSKA